VEGEESVTISGSFERNFAFHFYSFHFYFNFLFSDFLKWKVRFFNFFGTACRSYSIVLECVNFVLHAM